MVNPDHSWFICSFPYQLAIKEGLFSRDDIADQMLDDDFNEISSCVYVILLVNIIVAQQIVGV